MSTASNPVRIASVVGARPQFVKLAAVARAVRRAAAKGLAIEDFVLHTGQHYDPSMSDIFFRELDLPTPDVDLQVGSGTHGAQTARMLESIERHLLDRRADAVVVYGDTNSTIAGALAAAKLHIPVVHVEAGLRSRDRRMPEEINRVATDHLSDLLLAPTPTALRNLQLEGLGERTVCTGDVMLDAVRHSLALARQRSRILESLQLQPAQFGLVTIHRAANTEPHVLRHLLETLDRIAAEELPLVFPVHPRTDSVLRSSLPDWRPNAQLRLIQPLGYLDLLRLLNSARLLLTDSGGLQKEAFFLGCPCITLRDETEWVETVEAGGNVIAGTERTSILAAVEHWRRTRFDAETAAARGGTLFGHGDAGDRTVQAIISFLRAHEVKPVPTVTFEASTQP